MKRQRQRQKQEPLTSSATAEKKIKTEEETTVTSPEDALTAAAAMEEEMRLYGLGLRGGDVDEQMSWGTVWLPFWDVEFVGRNYGALFNDVAWDDDIWNLRAVTEVPRPLVTNERSIS